MNDHTEVCPLSREVMSLLTQPLSNRLQTGICFLRVPLPASPTVFFAVHLPCRAEIWAYHVLLKQQEWVRPCLSTGSIGYSRAPIQKEDSLATLPFWPSLSASLACSHVTMFISSSHLLVIPLSLAPHPH